LQLFFVVFIPKILEKAKKMEGELKRRDFRFFSGLRPFALVHGQVEQRAMEVSSGEPAVGETNQSAEKQQQGMGRLKWMESFGC
jgi:hypothetical protein